MAKLTFDEFKSILDYIEQRQPDSYSSLYLYVKEYTEKATVFKHPITDEEVRSVVDAIVIQESVQLVDSEHIYRLPVIRDASWVGSGAKPKDAVNVYDRFIAGYTNAEDIMNTICRAYGVILSESFKYEAPDDYNKILRLIAGFYNNAEDVRNQPFGAKKYGEEYLSYFPVYIIYEVGKYLSDLGVFEVTEKNYEPSFCYGYEYESLDLMSESEFKSNILGLINTRPTIAEHNKNMFNLISGLLDYNKFIVACPTLATSVGLVVYEFPANNFTVYYAPNATSFIDNDYNLTGNWRRFEQYIKSSEDSSYSIYTCSYNSSTGTYSYNKQTIELLENNVYKVTNPNFGGVFNNLNLGYKNLFTYKSIQNTPPRFSLGDIDGAYYSQGSINRLNDCNINNIELFSLEDIKYFCSAGRSSLEKLISNYDIEIDENDLVFCMFGIRPKSGVSTFVNEYSVSLNIVRGLNKFSVQLISDSNSSCFGLSSFLSGDLFSTTDFGGFGNTATFIMSGRTFSSGAALSITNDINFDLDSYNYDAYNDLFFHNSYKNNNIFTIGKEFKDLNVTNYGEGSFAIANIGRVVTPKPKPDWYTIESGAILPSNIASIQDLTATYPDWIAKQVRIHTPYYEGSLNEEVLTGLATVDFVPLSVSGANSQSEAQAGIIDVDNFDIVLEQIEDAEEDINPEEDPDVDPNDDPSSDDDGDTPDIPDLDDLPNVLGTGFVHQYKLTAGEVGNFAKGLNSFITAIQKVISDPMQAVISLQAGYAFNASGSYQTSILLNGLEVKWTEGSTEYTAGGLALTNNYVDFDLGSIDINPYFNNYLDFTNTELKLFLPFVGLTNINIDDFIKGSIKLKCRIDTLTGVIMYYVYSVRDGGERLIDSFDGNCQMNIPVTNTDFSRLFSSVMGIATSGNVAGAVSGVFNGSLGSLNKVGSITGNKGILNPHTPYIILKSKASYNPTTLESTEGLPVNSTYKLSACSGFVRVKEIHIRACPATAEEASKIESLLKEGVHI